MAGTIHLVDSRAFLVVHANEQTNDGEWTHTGGLRVDLGQIGHALGEYRDGARKAMVEGPLVGFVTSSLHEAFAVSHGASDTDTHLFGELEQVCDRVGFHESVGDLFLRHHGCRVGAADGYGRETRVCGFEAVFHLVQAALRRKDGNVVIIVAAEGGGEK